MDNLALIRVAAALDATLRGAVLRDLRLEAPARFRLVFEAAGGFRSIVASLRPERPWIGRPALRLRPAQGEGTPFAALARRVLLGSVVESVSKVGADRVLRLSFAEGHVLVAELATHGANLVLLDSGGSILGLARRSRSAAGRLAVSSEYRARDLPPNVLVPFGCPAETIDRYLAGLESGGESPFEGLRRHVFGVGTEGARLVLDEARASGRSPGEVLAGRLAALERGELDPAIDAAEDPLGAARRGVLDPRETRLLPWDPGPLRAGGRPLQQSGDAPSTVGVYYEALEIQASLAERGAGLLALLGRERERLATAEQRAGKDRDSFRDPERYRRWGEALLAGLSRARREGDVALVPDPYDESVDLAIPLGPGRTLQQSADDHFRAHRRALRGAEHAANRARELAARRARLEELEARFADSASEESLHGLEHAMREAGIPVGLERARRGSEPPRAVRPRLEGVRIYRTSEGSTVLVGRSARDNQRLTFSLAGAEDFWFHAAERRGAHVVLRNDDRLKRPSQVSLAEAAALAAWFSEGRQDEGVEVRWTRRKYVRRARGAPPGTVVLKRFETLRVRPKELED